MTEPDSSAPEVHPSPAPSNFALRGCGCLLALVVLGWLATAALPLMDPRSSGQVAQAQADMRSLATALESYMIDVNTYPPYGIGVSGINADAKPGDPASRIPTLRVWPNGGALLTTPTAFIEEIPRDAMSPSGKAGYGYFTTGRSWVLISAGPNRAYDLPGFRQLPTRSDGSLDLKQFVAWQYDSTNGSKSRGDLLKFGGLVGE